MCWLNIHGAPKRRPYVYMPNRSVDLGAYEESMCRFAVNNCQQTPPTALQLLITHL